MKTCSRILDVLGGEVCNKTKAIAIYSNYFKIAHFEFKIEKYRSNS